LILPSQARSIGLHHKKKEATSPIFKPPTSQVNLGGHGLGSCLPACLPACHPACLPAFLPASSTRKNINNETRGNTTAVKATPNKNQNTCTLTVKEKTKKIISSVQTNGILNLIFIPFAQFREMI